MSWFKNILKNNYKVIKQNVTFNLVSHKTEIHTKDEIYFITVHDYLHDYLSDASLHTGKTDWYHGLIPKYEEIIKLKKTSKYTPELFLPHDGKFVSFETNAGPYIIIPTDTILKVIRTHVFKEQVDKVLDVLEKLK